MKRVDLHETVEEAAEREMEEETGLAIRLGPPLGVSTSIKAAVDRMDDGRRPLKMVRILFAATVIGGTIRPEATGTTVDSAWFPIHAIGGLDTRPHVAEAIRLWQLQSSRA